MDNVFPVPKELQHRIESVSDNRKPGDEVVVNPVIFVALFRADIEKWLIKHRAKVAAAGEVSETA